MSLPAHVYLPALISIYISFFGLLFGFKASLIVALIMPILFFVLEASGIAVNFFAGEKNLKKAVIQVAFLLVVLSPIIIFACIKSHN